MRYINIKHSHFHFPFYLASVLTMLSHKNVHKRTWTASNGKATNQVNHVAIQQIKNGKAGGVDGLTIELIKADLETPVTTLCKLFFKIWESKKVHNEWRCGLIIRLPKKSNRMEC